MEYAAFKYIGAGLTSFGMLGAAIGVGIIFAAMLEGIARNPGSEDALKRYVYIGAGLSEAMGLFALVIGLVLIFVV